ncbi:unnamed protein product [Notodromas monacha]|uniref:RHD domain-containing protein n=1 Tax=Notodromas monacha TaxID=399045 RepID=A0A7R9BJH9_9CRUS|nr:unnamed protein product [Notodromas monacha]CAG0915893.1 unnamed protein product [Notodromas monacha]
MSADIKDEAFSPNPVARCDGDAKKEPYVVLLEQPASKALRFRYICEGRSAGSLPGERTHGTYKTHPTIQVMGYHGPAVVVVSCVTKDPPFRPHPHNLVGREGCDKGVCTMYIDPNTMKCQFQNLGIQCVRKRDIAEALDQRQQIKVDPFQTGFDHKHQPNSIDLNSLRLCFQVFIEGEQKNKYVVPLKPVVSEPIYDRKAVSDLNICKMSHCNDTVAGGREVILLCEKVAKENISVRFYEESPQGEVTWEDFGKFQPSDVHKQVAICLRTPRYRTLDVTDVVKCRIQLMRPSDKATSAPRAFEYHPLDPGTANSVWSQKNSKASYDSFRHILAADSGALLTNIRDESKMRIRVSKASQTTMSITTDEGNDNWIEMSAPGMLVEEKSHVMLGYFETLKAYAKDAKLNLSKHAISASVRAEAENMQNGNYLPNVFKETVDASTNVDEAGSNSNGLSPPPVPPKRKKTQKTQTTSFGTPELNGNFFPDSVDPTFAISSNYDHLSEVTEFESDLHEKAALYEGSPPLATMSELDDLDALSLYAKMDEVSGDSNTNDWGRADSETPGNNLGSVTPDKNENNLEATLKIGPACSPLYVDDPDYIPLPVLDLFV